MTDAKPAGADAAMKAQETFEETALRIWDDVISDNDGYCNDAVGAEFARRLRTEWERNAAPLAWGVPNSRPTEGGLMQVMLDTTGAQYPELLVPLYEHPDAASAPGMVRVPIEPTGAMCTAGWFAWNASEVRKIDSPTACYKAMIEARPK